MGSVRLGVCFVSFWQLWAVARFSGFRGGDVLHPDDRRTVCFAFPPAQYGAAVPSVRLSGAPGDVSAARCEPRSAIVALQAAIHLARIGHYFIWRAGLLAVAEIAGCPRAQGCQPPELAARAVAR